jgi:hypothetical protein
VRRRASGVRVQVAHDYVSMRVLFDPCVLFVVNLLLKTAQKNQTSPFIAKKEHVKLPEVTNRSLRLITMFIDV